MLRRYGIWVILAALLTATLIHSYQIQNSTVKSLTYFPNDPNIEFSNAITTLSFQPDPSSRSFIHWTTLSETNMPVYLRHDVGLLFQNGKLIQVANNWKSNTSILGYGKTIEAEGTSHFEALSVHYAESHMPNEIRSQETMSYDHLYVVSKGNQNKAYFKVPAGTEQMNYQSELTRSLQQELQHISEQAAKTYNINLKNYDLFPLTHLEAYEENAFPDLDQKTTQRVIRQLWEGLYKNYVTGIHVGGGKPESPIGSFVPLILYPKKGNQLLVILKTKSGHLVLLKQNLK